MSLNLSYDKEQLNMYLSKNHLDEITNQRILDPKRMSSFPMKEYITRGLEIQLVKKICDNEKILISGWAGSGKTTLLLYSLYKYQELLPINIKVLYKTIKENSSYLTTHDLTYTMTKEIIDDLTRLYCQKDSEYENFLYFHALITNFNFIQYGIENVPFIDKNSNIAREINNIKNQLNNKKTKNKLQSNIEKTLKQNNELSYLKSLISYVTTYKEQPVYIVYDNLDVALLEVQKNILDAINTTLFSCSNKNFKIIVLLRNDKLYDAVHRSTDDSINVSRFPISNNNKRLKDKFQNPKSTTIFNLYINKLTRYYNQNPSSISKEHFYHLIDIVNALTDKEINSKFLYTNIFQLSNHSIRFALEFINEFAHWIIDNNLSKQLSNTNYNATYIHSLFYAWVSMDNFQLCVQGLNPIPVIKNVEENFNSLGCDIDYLLLTYLTNKKEIEFQNLYNSFLKISNETSEDTIKNHLFNLYTNNEQNSSLLGKYGHILFMYNKGSIHIINNINQIKNDTIISILPRAKAILKTSFKFTFSNFLFYKTFISIHKPIKNYFQNYKNNIIDYLDYQYFMLIRLYSVHLIELYRIYTRFNYVEGWIEAYKDDFAFKKSNDLFLQLENIIDDNKKFISLLIKKYPNIEESLLQTNKKIETLLTQFTNSYSNIGNAKVENLVIKFIQEKFNECTTKNDYETLYSFLNKKINLKYYFKNPEICTAFFNALTTIINSSNDKKILKQNKDSIQAYFSQSQYLSLNQS